MQANVLSLESDVFKCFRLDDDDDEDHDEQLWIVDDDDDFDEKVQRGTWPIINCGSCRVDDPSWPRRRQPYLGYSTRPAVVIHFNVVQF